MVGFVRLVKERTMERPKKNTSSPIAYFWQNLKKNNVNGCWEWQAKQDKGGYGYFGMNAAIFRVHRFSFELHCHPIPKGLLVCHECDNPRCCNPKHLFLGTQLDNAKDRIAKGRSTYKGTPKKPRKIK